MMMIAKFMHYYNYTLEAVLDMYAITFYALYSTIGKIVAENNINDVYLHAVAASDGENVSNYIRLNEQIIEGVDYYTKQAQVLKEISK